MDHFIADCFGMKCRVFKSYIIGDSRPLIMITSSDDIEKAYSLGFTCIGYPTEIAKEISIEEYESLAKGKSIL
ncbi:MAG: hypothetical protein IJX77_00145 [Ruminococcus sp.]|nr:hypothetical protein [Ruminococcus sp.]